MSKFELLFVDVLGQAWNVLILWVVLIVDVASSQIEGLKPSFDLGQIHI